VIMTGSGEVEEDAIRPRARADAREKDDEVRIPVGKDLNEARRQMILQTFAATDGDREETARILDLDEETLDEELMRLLGPEAEPVG
ncbi:MAG: hypothetical protein ABEJ46_00600, partial [Gemmatimonadota bacterium]